MSAREQLHALVERLPDDQVESALRLLESIRSSENADPVLETLLRAPEDDEPLSEADRVAVDEALAAIKRGDSVPWDEFRKQFE